jgi:hypothetical protein
MPDPEADAGAHFVTGAAILSSLVFVLCALHLAYPLLMYGCGAAILAWERPRFRRPTPTLWAIPFAVYGVLYLCHALAPESSPDGAGYHLGLVMRYLSEHGFVRITDNFYAAMPGGVEMLYLFAFPLGAHSSASLIHLAFLAALVWQVYRYAGVPAALLVAAAPVIGRDATSAYNDVALAAVAFTLFVSLRKQRHPAILGLLAGFALAIKYTGWAAIIYAVAIVAWQSRRAAAITASVAAAVAAPWLIKNWLYLGNPLSPFLNSVFPNPYVTEAFEETYRRMFAANGLSSRWSIPWEATTGGALSGVLGPVFLLAPLGLLVLRRKQGWHLWLAAGVFAASYFQNTGTRFLIPSVAFVAIALTLALPRRVALALALVHAVLSWPSIVPRYARPTTWRIEKFPWREALRIRTPDHYLETHLIGYGIDRLIDARTLPGSTVFTFTPIPEAYTSRHIRIEHQAAENQIAGAILWTAVEPGYAPIRRYRFAFPRRSSTGVRLVQTGTGDAQWTIHELRLFDGAAELLRDPDWRLTAEPYPWGVTGAFDNSPVTFWRSGQRLRPGQRVEIDFAHERMLDAVTVQSSPNQAGLAIRLELRDGAGKWSPVPVTPSSLDTPRPLGLRRAAAHELKRRGIDYVLLQDGQVGAEDFREAPDLWDATPLGEYKGARLYQLK